MDLESILREIGKILKSIKNLIFLLRPLTEPEKQSLATLNDYLPENDIKQAEKYLRQKRITIADSRVPYSKNITLIRQYPKITVTDNSIELIIEAINNRIEKVLEKKIAEEFKKDAWQRLNNLYAPEIVGFGNVKKGCILQLFSKEPIHILLLGDPGTGKTDILRATEKFAPISEFGLGSGTTNTGLTVTVIGKEISKGILSLADNGIALIDELNLMKKDDRAGLYNAMEKGFITFDKGGHHFKFDARCAILASANPLKDKFRSREKKDIQKQLPFDSALLSRFHLIYLIREADTEQFLKIAEGVLSKKETTLNEKDSEFIKSYIESARELEVEFPETHNDMITSFVRELKEKEDRMLVDVTPRMIIGLKRMIDASARISHKKSVSKEDIWRAMEAMTLAFEEITF